MHCPRPIRQEIAVRLAVCTVFLTVLTMSAQERQVGQGVNFYSMEKEAALGAQLAKEVRQKTTPIDSAVTRDYVEKIGRQLAAALPNSRFTYTFAVILDDVGGETHEPLSFPGGYIFVPANLILTAQNEAALAGMLAHAMAHVAERHGTRQATFGELSNIASVPLIFVGGGAGLGAGGNERVVPISFLSVRRRFETEADVLAIKLTSGSGYDPKALVSYISRVQPGDADRSPVAEVFSWLPRRDVRITSMEKTIQELPPKAYTSSSNEFPRIQDEVRRLRQR
jgi:beta-barrel assembly-enhancing protease